jgi:serine protease Do
MNLLQQLSQEMTDVVGATRRSLVQVTNGRAGNGSGSGIVWRSDGLIITNAHVVRNKQVSVSLPDGRKLPARVLAHDPERDVAALKVEANDLRPIELGDSENLKPGEWAFAVGHPFGVEGAATAGVIIGSGGNLPEQRGREWVMVNLRLRPGNSGGPLVDVQGRLIGVNTIMTGAESGGAVPVHVVQRFLAERLA